MKKHKKYVGLCICLGGLLWSLPACAGWWIGPYTVLHVEVMSDAIYFQQNEAPTVDYEVPGMTSCQNMWAVKFPFADSASDKVLAVGLSAQATGVKVKFYVTGCDGYIKATGIATNPAW